MNTAGLLLTFVYKPVINKLTINHLYMKTVNTKNWFYHYRANNETLNVVHLTEEGCPSYEGLTRGIRPDYYKPYSPEEISQLINEKTRVVINNLDHRSYIPLLNLDLFNGVGALWIHGAFHPFDLSSLEVGSSRFHLLNVNGNFTSPQTRKFAGYVTPEIYVQDYSARGNVCNVKPGDSQSSFHVTEGCEQVSITGADQILLPESINEVKVINSHTVNIGNGETSYSIQEFNNGTVNLRNGTIKHNGEIQKFGPLVLNCSESFAIDNFPIKIS